jgi:signal transduction histidine kinase
VGIVGITVGTTRGRQLALVVALACAFTVLGLQVVPPAGTPTEMWATHAVAFLWTSVVWDGRTRPEPALAGHLAAQLVLFWGTGLAFGWPPLDLAWMGLANVAGGVLLLVLYARLRAGTTWAPITQTANLGLLGLAVGVSFLIALVGGFPGLAMGDLDRLTLWWVLRGTVYAYVAGVTLMMIFHFDEEVVERASRWTVIALLPLGAVCVWLTYLDPSLPLSWFLLLPALVGGSVLSPRGAAIYALVIAMLSALATLSPTNRFDYDGFFPASVIIDALVTAATLITVHLAVLRLQRTTATAELERQRSAASEQALLLGTVFETMSDGLVVLGPDRSVTLHNGAARQLMGRPIPIGRPRNWVQYFDLTRPDGSTLDPAELTWGDGGTYRGELRVSERLLDVTSWPLGDRGGRTVVLFSDVTSNRERLSELAGFAGVVAHDLRSPLASLHGWLEMAEESLSAGSSEKAGEFVARAQVSSERMRRVIEDWLAYTVQRDGVLTRSAVPLGEVVDEVVASYGRATGRAPEFVVDVDHTVEADRVLTTQLLANLVGNAVKYCREGDRPHVEIRSRADAEEGFVRVDVTDRGIGLPPGEEERVFEEFHRADAHRGSYSGTGLGLSLCRRIVDRHGGTITARNNRDADGGPGATFSFTLPSR